MSFITIRRFSTVMDAHIVRVLLENNGIPSEVFDENIATVNPLYIQAIGGIRLMVSEQDKEKALLLLEQMDQDQISNDLRPE